MANNVVIKVSDDAREELDIFDVKEFRSTGTFFAIVPSFYNCEIVFAPKVLQAMLQWLIKEKYVILEGTLTIPVRNVRKNYNG